MVLGLIAFVRPDNSVIDPKVYEIKFKTTYQISVTMTTPAAETNPSHNKIETDTRMGYRSRTVRLGLNTIF